VRALSVCVCVCVCVCRRGFKVWGSVEARGLEQTALNPSFFDSNPTDSDDLDKTQVEYSLDEYFEEPIEDVKVRFYGMICACLDVGPT
jgi:hypothetical protein